MNPAIATEKISHPYHLELTEDDRFSLLVALGSFAGLCHGNPPPAWLSLTKRVASLAPRLPITVTATVDQQGGKAAAAAILSPPATPNPTVPADHWAKKKPDSWDTIEVPIAKVEERSGANGKFLRVTWPNQGRGFAYGSVFDEALFPVIRAREKQKTVLYTVTAGKYTNIVGVRA